MTTAERSMRIGASSYPVVLPSLRDPRLHLAAVIISIHVLGQTVLGFRVSVPQILSAIVTCALLEVAWTFATSKQIVWPASAMLTGSGVALILRLVGMDRGDRWTWTGWHLFALVAAVSLATKYLLRYRGRHLFNPSNIGLVAAFLLLGSEVIEPLDFWWAPLELPMVAAYLIITLGGLIITARLRLLSMAAAFWLSLGVGLAILSISGHCITAAWSLQPVCGPDFWRVVMTSPELLVFLFFMITDPKTTPAREPARVIFAVALGIACSLLMASQSTEFGAKVGLLGGLVLLTPARFAFDYLVERTHRWAPTGAGRKPFLIGAGAGASVVLMGAAIVAAGAPARAVDVISGAPPPLELALDPLPEVTISPEVEALNSSANPTALAHDLAVALAVENQAMLQADTSILRSVAEGERLLQMERLVQEAAVAGRFVVAEYSFAELRLDVVYSEGPQGGADLALAASGQVTEIEYDDERVEVARSRSPFARVFVLAPGPDNRWLIKGVHDPS